MDLGARVNQHTANHAILAPRSLVLRHCECGGGTYVDTYERRPSGARGRSISLSSLRGHRVAATPLRDIHVAVVASGEVDVRFDDGGGGGGDGVVAMVVVVIVAALQGVASEEKPFPHAPPSPVSHDPAECSTVRRQQGEREGSSG